MSVVRFARDRCVFI